VSAFGDKVLMQLGIENPINLTLHKISLQEMRMTTENASRDKKRTKLELKTTEHSFPSVLLNVNGCLNDGLRTPGL
jgi:hypothetical protein